MVAEDGLCLSWQLQKWKGAGTQERGAIGEVIVVVVEQGGWVWVGVGGCRWVGGWMEGVCVRR